MHLIVCVDDRGGLSFCGRRLSRDRLLNEHILRISAGHRLWIHPYSRDLFPANAVAHEDFLSKAQPGDYCFAETAPIPVDLDLESVIVCCWNRSYPSDVKFPRELLKGLRVVQTEDFPGNSHEKITMEIYAP